MLAATDLQHHPDRYDSARQVQDLMAELQPRGKVIVEIEIPHSPPPVITTGPTPYEQAKSEEDAWE